MPAGLEAVVIADDLTGAADTGVQLAALGSPIYLVPVETLSPRRPWMTSAAGLSVDTASRHLSPKAAAKRLRRVARELPGLRPRWIYKKIDSGLRGNLGAEIDVLLDTLEIDAALVAPALPAQGRTTIDGIHRVDGTPVGESELANDPVAPVTCSTVADILAGQSRYPVGRIDLTEYGASQRLQQAVHRERQRGCRLIVCDAAVQGHLNQVAALVIQGAGRLLPVGSAGLASSLVGRLSSREMVEPSHGKQLERLLLVCGTGSQVTRGQMDTLLDRYPGVRRELEPDWLVEALTGDVRRCAAEMLNAWTGGVLVLQIRPIPATGPAVDPQQVIAGLAGLASEIVRANCVDGLFLSGGETADAFRRATGGEAIKLERELLPGLVLGRWLGGAADGLPVITKAGTFGAERTLIALYERLSAGARL